MTDFPPRNAVARFGVSVVGPKFVWTHLDDDYEPVDSEFRAHPGFSFEEQLDYQASLSMMQAQAQVDQQALIKRLDELQAKLVAGEVTEDEVIAGTLAETESSLDSERERFKMVVDQTLMLVHPKDREALEPLLAAGNSVDVRNLRAHLMDVVINRVKAEVEAVGGVDPT